jgi:glycosyltransferase involved in cell wall biosynthesis
MRFLFIESFFQGSHRLFAEGLRACSSHEIDILSMPGENWRWRMLGAALHVAETVPSLKPYDGVIISDLFNLSDFKALVSQPCPPVMAYFHENQITYPQPPGDKGAFQLGIINISTALAADKVVFNSWFHRNAFLEAVPQFLDRGRDFRPGDSARKITNKSMVLYPGITLEKQKLPFADKHTEPPLIIWNHRWGYDKQCDTFVEAIEALEAKGLDFRLAIMGENFGKIPEAFENLEQRFKSKILHYGYVTDRHAYEGWLQKGAIAVSTALQENYGMSMLEAMIMGCAPLMPDRLAYPEILPEAFHDHFLYKHKYDLVEKLTALVTDIQNCETLLEKLAGKMISFLWPHVVKAYDDGLEQLASLKN